MVIIQLVQFSICGCLDSFSILSDVSVPRCPIVPLSHVGQGTGIRLLADFKVFVDLILQLIEGCAQEDETVF